MQFKRLYLHLGPSPQPRKSSAAPLPTMLYHTEGSGTQPMISRSGWPLKQDLTHVQKTNLRLWLLQYCSRKEFTECERWSLKEEKAQLKKSMSKADPLMCNNGAEPGSLSSKQGLCLEVLCRGCAWTTLSMEGAHGTRTHAPAQQKLHGDGFFWVFFV